MNLQLSLKKQWFEMTRDGIKTEDYRSLTPYWYNKLCLYDGKKRSKKFWEHFSINNMDRTKVIANKDFKTTTLTLGYPSKTDTSRIIQFEHLGIEINYGKSEWGAEPGKLYFVIKHGKRL